MRFTKMHGIGNDYVYVNGFEETVRDPAALAPRIADRHTGVGGDGLILILPPESGVKADVRMRMFNADGSESEMCGNGVRCVAKYAFDHGLTKARPMRVQTGNGVLTIDYTLDANGKLATATVDMGEPILELPKVPVDATRFDATLEGAMYVSMGNPHATFFVKDVAAVELAKLGPKVEHHAAFPRRINVHYVQVHSPGELTMRTWERGSGITMACGTGACAVAVSGVLTHRTARKVLAHLPGGDLTLEWRETDNHVYMTGPAVEVFSGDWPE
ncbi:MAG: diaminopimelate epimerase [Planctomycetes bacterium]|nr:diaminopimelate epimerase [Planctomycetota bacterium]